MNEKWKMIKGYKGLYEVSNYGRIRSLERMAQRRGQSPKPVSNRILKPILSSRGYLKCSLSKRGRVRVIYVHRIVLETFNGISSTKTVTNHKNFNQKDNRITNLEWVTQKENVHHAITNGHTGNKTFKGELICQQ